MFAKTSFFRQTPQYGGSAVMPLGQPTDDTRVLLAATRQALRKFFRPGFGYAKAGICLLDVQPRSEVHAQQKLVFEVRDSAAKSQKVNQAIWVLDQLNTRYGRDTVKLGSSVHDDTAAWQMRQERMSPSYTTRWEDLVEVWR